MLMPLFGRLGKYISVYPIDPTYNCSELSFDQRLEGTEGRAGVTPVFALKLDQFAVRDRVVRDR